MADEHTRAEKRKKKCRSVINNGLRDGKIKKPKCCSKCHKYTTKLTGHHNKGYGTNGKGRIIWLCYSCHKIETDKSHGWSRASGQKGKGWHNKK